MTKHLAIITLSNEGASIAAALSEGLLHTSIYVHESVETQIYCRSFSRTLDLVSEIFGSYDGLIFIGPCGVAVRAIAPHISHKTRDPAVVVVDVCARWSISLLSGHEGGANDLAVEVSNIIGSDPIITTTTEARKNIIVGVGCKRGVTSGKIKAAILNSLNDLQLPIEQVRFIATIDAKASEKGLILAAQELQVPLRLISSNEIMNSSRDFYKSGFVQQSVGVPGVSEPCALLAGRRTQLIQKRKIFEGITIAISRENCL